MAYQEQRAIVTVTGPASIGSLATVLRGGIPRVLLEIVMVPNAACVIQLFDNGLPMSAAYPLAQNQKWSAPGKVLLGDLAVTISNATVVQFELRFIEGIIASEAAERIPRQNVFGASDITAASFPTSLYGPWGPGNTVPPDALLIGVQDPNGDLAPLNSDFSGNLQIGTSNGQILSVRQFANSVPQLTQAAVSFNTTGDNTIVAAVAAQTIRIHRLILSVSTPTNLIFKDSTPTNFSGAMPFAANGGLILDFDSGEPWYKTAVGKAFVINQSGTAQVSGTVYYEQSL